MASSEPPYTIIGTPYSTYTRSVTLGMHYKGVPFKQVRCTPHSDTAQQYHTFGFLPTLIIHDIDGKKVDLKLRESAAIVRYIDRLYPEPSLHLTIEETKDALVEEKMWEFVSLASAHGFPTVEPGVVKPRVALGDEGKLSDSEIREKIAPGVEKLQFFLSQIQDLMAPTGFVFGKRVTWADFFLYPLMADLRATPEGENITPRIKAWLSTMDELDAVKRTHEGTLSSGARPP